MRIFRQAPSSAVPRARIGLPSLAVVLVALFLGPALQAAAQPPGKTIVLIGGKKSHGAGEHDFYHGLVKLETMLKESPEFKQQKDVEVVASFFDWPKPETLARASTLVMYFDGLDMSWLSMLGLVKGGSHLLADEARRAEFEELMAKGVGLVMLHQAFTVPADDTSIELERWLGGARYGMFDRVTDTVTLAPSSPTHPVSRGLSTFSYRDEFYPTMRFAADGKRTPILSGEMAAQSGQGIKGPQSPRDTVVAWAYERENSGRSLAFSGAHYLRSFDQPQIRQMLLNAIFWTAGLEVPEGGVTTDAPLPHATKLASPAMGRPPITESIVVRRSEVQVLPQDWGKLEWHVSGPLGNSDTLTTGIATVGVGKSNPRHFHPNCDEVLHVLEGRVRHTMNDTTVVLDKGDTVSIPQGTLHNATNIGDRDAVLAISFSSAWREVVGE